MAASWKGLLRGVRAEIDGDSVHVQFENGRSHRVRIDESDALIELHAVAAKAAAVRDVPDLPLRIWRHNRQTQLVSLKLDSQGRVCARGWVPKAGLLAEEFQLVLRRVAAESDRIEFLLTGKDSE